MSRCRVVELARSLWRSGVREVKVRSSIYLQRNRKRVSKADWILVFFLLDEGVSNERVEGGTYLHVRLYVLV